MTEGSTKDMHKELQILAVSLIGFVTAFQADAEIKAHNNDGVSRHALIIGVETYQHLPALARVQADAVALEALLAQAGFSVTAFVNPDLTEVTNGVTEFLGSIETNDDVLIYVTGHGADIDGTTFLAMRDTGHYVSDHQFSAESLALEPLMLAANDAGASATSLIIDTCRERIRPLTRSLSLASPETRNIGGSFLLYTAQQGACPLESIGRHDDAVYSVFMRYFLESAAVEGVSLQDAASETRRSVFATTVEAGHAQILTVIDSMLDPFILLPVQNR